MSFKKEIEKGYKCNSINKPHSIIAKTVCIGVHPGKILKFPFFKIFDKHYHGKYGYARTIFLIDMFLVGVMFTLSCIALYVWLFPSVNFADKIIFDATVAPREIVSGAQSTLVIRYTNNTDEELSDVSMDINFPAHFLLQEFYAKDKKINENKVDIGTIPIGGTGTVRISGVMFGDVGGEQIFESHMTFTHGKNKDIFEEKTSIHTFSPTKSTLELSLLLPEKLVSFQGIQGVIEYKNTGKIDFPEITIKPTWPDGFRYINSTPVINNGLFKVPAITSGETGKIMFNGYLSDAGENTLWTFDPKFSFDTDNYKQDTLVHYAAVVPPPIKLEHSIDSKDIKPGNEVAFIISYENISENTVTDINIGIESDSPFLRDDVVFSKTKIDSLAPGETEEIVITTRLRSSIYQSETNQYEDLVFNSRTLASYILGDGSTQKVTSYGPKITSLLTTPVVFDSSAKYVTSSGDQLGRGPLPPKVGKETTYWVFLHVGGTTNPIKNVAVEASLSENTRFTGKQSVSQDTGIDYNSKTHSIEWFADTIYPTLSPTSKIVGVAFEIGITPSEDQIGTAPTLLENISFSAIDSNTGAFLNKSASNITTNLPNDVRAASKAEVE